MDPKLFNSQCLGNKRIISVVNENVARQEKHKIVTCITNPVSWFCGSHIIEQYDILLLVGPLSTKHGDKFHMRDRLL